MYESTTRLELDSNLLILGKGDFAAALNKVIPASRRGVSGTPARPLDNIVLPLLKGSLDLIMEKIHNVLPMCGRISTKDEESVSGSGTGSYSSSSSSSSSSTSSSSSSSSSSTSSVGMIEDDSTRIARRIEEERLALDQISPDGESWIAALTDMQDDSVLEAVLGTKGDMDGVGGSGNVSGSGSNGQVYDSVSVSHSVRGSVSASGGGSGSGTGSGSNLTKFDNNSNSNSNNSTLWDTSSVTSNPRVMIVGKPGMGQENLVAAVLQSLEGVPCFTIDYPSLLADLNAQ